MPCGPFLSPWVMPSSRAARGHFPFWFSRQPYNLVGADPAFGLPFGCQPGAIGHRVVPSQVDCRGVGQFESCRIGRTPWPSCGGRKALISGIGDRISANAVGLDTTAMLWPGIWVDVATDPKRTRGHLDQFVKVARISELCQGLSEPSAKACWQAAAFDSGCKGHANDFCIRLSVLNETRGNQQQPGVGICCHQSLDQRHCPCRTCRQVKSQTSQGTYPFVGSNRNSGDDLVNRFGSQVTGRQDVSQPALP